jgi:ribosomal protein L40E
MRTSEGCGKKSAVEMTYANSVAVRANGTQVYLTVSKVKTSRPFAGRGNHASKSRIMALIDCPECGAKISERAPTCPKCGFPIAVAGGDPATRAEPMAADTMSDAPASAAPDATTTHATPATDPPPLPTERSAEPIRIGGRRIPIAALLFWGGMVLGVVLKFGVFGGGEVPKPYSYAPYLMLFGGVLWFSVTEFTMLVRNRRRR